MRLLLIALLAGCGSRAPDTLIEVPTPLGWGWVDRTGAMRIGGDLLQAAPFREGLAGARTSAGWGFVDRNGALVITPQWDEVGLFCEGRAAVLRGTLWGYVDTAGTVVVEPAWDEASCFGHGRAAVERGGLWALIDPYGAEVVEPRFTSVALGTTDEVGRPLRAFEMSLAAVSIGEGTERRYGYVDVDGNWVLQPNFADAARFVEDRAAVVDVGAEAWAYIDTSGRKVIAPSYAAANEFSEGLAATVRAAAQLDPAIAALMGGGGLPGMGITFVGRGGEPATPLAWTEVGRLSEGLVWVRDGDEVGYVDRMGGTVVPFEYTGASSFRGGLARVTRGNDGQAVIDLTGRVVWPRSADAAP